MIVVGLLLKGRRSYPGRCRDSRAWGASGVVRYGSAHETTGRGLGSISRCPCVFGHVLSPLHVNEEAIVRAAAQRRSGSAGRDPHSELALVQARAAQILREEQPVGRRGGAGSQRVSAPNTRLLACSSVQSRLRVSPGSARAQTSSRAKTPHGPARGRVILRNLW